MQMEKIVHARNETHAEEGVGIVDRLVWWCSGVAGASYILWKPMAPNSRTLYIYIYRKSFSHVEFFRMCPRARYKTRLGGTLTTYGLNAP